MYFIDKPVIWHMSRVPSGYDFDAMTTAEHTLLFSKWHNWWTADLDYAQTVVIFFCVAILASALLNLAGCIRSHLIRPLGARIGFGDRVTALVRYTTSRQFYFAPTDWYSPPLAAVLGVCGLFLFLMGLTLAARPFYWPNDAMGDSPPIATRAGWISLAILPFMIAFATKVNFIAFLTHTSHEKLQVFHRWAAFFMYITSLIHTFPFIVNMIRMGMMRAMWIESSFYWTGVAALVPQTWLVLMSWGPIRNRWYEFFKKIHFIAAGFFMAALFCHVDWTLTSWHYFWATAAIYGLAWLLRVVRTAYRTGFGLPSTIESVGPDLVRIHIRASASRPGFTWTPGQHVFIRVLGLHMHALTSHPFTVSSVYVSSPDSDEEACVDLVLRARGGLTQTLARMAATAKPGGWSTRVVLDGPYGGLRSAAPRPLTEYDRVLFLAGGTGATFAVPIFRDLVGRLQVGEEAGDVEVVDPKTMQRVSRIDFVVAVADAENYAWMRPQLEAAAATRTNEAVSINLRVHSTRIANPDAKVSDPTGDVDESQKSPLFCYGRPALGELVHEAHASAARVAVIACGPQGFLYDVRNAVASCELDIFDGFGICSDLFLHTETYSW
ncbi:Ferric-chelate reductase [Mycena chlorophos]|uniref:ferric-chelate reductase (NADPH) n=1 Tax=Mycena chlorophos TaxID=658473 RepID=A0A8H6RZ55_MYCCL|nr:Ferric-chelate reductase [Mycena chlorophos]